MYLSTTCASIFQIYEDLEAVQVDCNDWKSKYELMSQKFESLEGQLDNTKKELSMMQEEKDKLESEKALVMDKLSTAETKRQSAEAEVSRIQALLLQAQSELSTTKINLQSAQRDNDRLNARIDEKEKQIDARDADIKEVSVVNLLHKFDVTLLHVLTWFLSKAHNRIEDLLEQLNNAKFELQDTKRALDKNDANTKRELEMALRALAAEKTANDLLHGDMAGHKAEVEALTSEVKALKSSGNSSKSEVDKL